MKSQRRHELQQNELAAWITQVGERLRPYTNLIAVVLVGGALIALATTWWMRQSQAGEAGAWDRILASLDARQPAELEKLAEQHAGSEAAAWARATAGDMYLATGCHELFSNKATAAQELRKATENYLVALQQTDLAALRERATFGLGRAYEALAGTRQGQGELDKAIEQYRQLVETWPDGVYAKIATQRLEDLQRHEILAFYDEFAKFDPKPAFSEGPTGEGPALDTAKPPDSGEVPDLLKAAKVESPSEPTIPLGQPPAEAGSSTPGEGETAEASSTGPAAPRLPAAGARVETGETPGAAPAAGPDEDASQTAEDTPQPAGGATEEPPSETVRAGADQGAGEAQPDGAGGEAPGSD